MFFLGDNSLAIDHYFTAGRELAGGRLLSVHYDEMNEAQLRKALTCLGRSLDLAGMDNASQDILDALEEPYKEVFTLLCYASFQFRKYVASGKRKERSEEYLKIALSAN